MSLRARLLIALSTAFSIFVIGLGAVTISLQSKITQRLEKGWVLPPLEVYSQGIVFSPGRRMPKAALDAEFAARALTAGRDFEWSDAEACARVTGLTFNDRAKDCLIVKAENLVVTYDEFGWIRDLYRGLPLTKTDWASLYPRLITQFFDGQPILQINTPLSDMPLYCLQAATAIEDRDFLVHRGVSPTGILRAVMRNLMAGRWAEGGSTITQQLVKNFFLNSRKTLKRKIEEQLLAIMLESQIGKDQILEMYLNVIYMGQSGPYQVRGFGAASQAYFDKPIARLNLEECALLAAVINNPGRYSPFKFPESAQARRELVLSKMREENMIADQEKGPATVAPLPALPPEQKRAHAPYFVMTALKEFQSWDLSAESGAKIYTTLDAEAQSLMMSGIAKVIGAVEGKIKKPSKQPLQVAALTIDLASAQVLALTGGRDYRATQFNRAFDSRRQIGSVVKPFVYWPALSDTDHDPLTVVIDEPFEWKVGKNVWKPRNYDGKTHGEVPYFFALAQSLNIPAAKVGQEVGLERIADTIQKSGSRGSVPRLPSLTLGAFEVSPWEVAQGFTTLGRFGLGDHIHTVVRVEDPHGEGLYMREPSTTVELGSQASAVLVGMMKQSLEVGTARAARAWGLTGPFAGKTGTTSDTKDAWFVGFNAHLLTVVWVGYDDNTAMGLTGASAALPVWTEIAKAHQALFENADFAWPEGVELRKISRAQLQSKFPNLPEMPEELELVFANWAY